MALILVLSACQRPDLGASTSLAGKTLKGTATSATGTFAGMEGYQFITNFSHNTFETKNASGALESAGLYNFNAERLILQSTGGLHPQKTIEIKLKFTDHQSGTYEINGPTGQQTGIFSIQ